MLLFTLGFWRANLPRWLIPNVDLHAEVMQVGGHLVANLVVITIDDLEALESSVQTFGFGQLLSDYAANCKDRLISLHNYIVGESKYGNALVYSDRLRTTFPNQLKQSETGLDLPDSQPVSRQIQRKHRFAEIARLGSLAGDDSKRTTDA